MDQTYLSDFHELVLIVMTIKELFLAKDLKKENTLFEGNHHSDQKKLGYTVTSGQSDPYHSCKHTAKAPHV